MSTHTLICTCPMRYVGVEQVPIVCNEQWHFLTLVDISKVPLLLQAKERTQVHVRFGEHRLHRPSIRLLGECPDTLIEECDMWCAQGQRDLSGFWGYYDYLRWQHDQRVQGGEV